MKRSSIDIGSNTTLLPDRRIFFTAILSESTDAVQKILTWGNFRKEGIEEVATGEWVTALGKNLDRTKHRRFNSEGRYVLQENHRRGCISSWIPSSALGSFASCHWQRVLHAGCAQRCYRNIIEAHGLKVEETLVTATEAARVATNAKDFFREIEETLGFRVHVITGEGEAYYTFRGVLQGDETSVIMDIGGASTELIKVSDGLLERTVSLPVGSVRGSDWKAEGQFGKRLGDILADQRFGIASFQTDRLIGVGGTMTSLAAISKQMRNFDCREIEGSTISLGDFQDCVEFIEDLSEEQLGEKFPFLGKRVKSIKAGGRLAFTVGKFLDVQFWKISTKGLRHGTLREGRIDERFQV